MDVFKRLIKIILDSTCLKQKDELISPPTSPDGGIGRRARLKIWLSQGSAGSIPVLGTLPPFLGGIFLP